LKKFVNVRLAFWATAFLLVGLALRKIPLHQVAATLGSLSGWQIFSLALANVTLLLFMNVRWWLILRALGYRVSQLALLAYRLSAFGVSYFTPGPQFGGEPLQIYLLHTRQGISTEHALTAVTLDKLLELLANFSFLAIGAIVSAQIDFLHGTGRGVAILLALVLLAIPAGYLAALWRRRLPLNALLKKENLQKWLPQELAKATQVLARSENEAASFCRARPFALLQAYLISLGLWILMLGEYWLSLRYLGVQLSLPLTIALLTLARFAFFSPMPAGLGVLEASQIFALEALGYPQAVGISLSLLIRARDVTLGTAGLWLGSLLSQKPGIKALPRRVQNKTI
jgi:uncharacterized protein (TIRG00374 family)